MALNGILLILKYLKNVKVILNAVNSVKSSNNPYDKEFSTDLISAFVILGHECWMQIK